ncbi:MAG: DUF1553 domain-containing protein [Gemmataceae bacterium]
MRTCFGSCIALLAGFMFSNGAHADTKLDARQLTARIDRLVAQSWAKQGVRPAPLADDAEFFRRASLDLNGCIPSVAELRDFLDDRRVDKRRLWIDKLLDEADHQKRYSRHFAAYWRRQILAQAPPPMAALAPQFEDWLRGRFERNAPHRQLVHDLLMARETSAFYQAHENKPENIAGAAARLFLGLKLECAQCHDDRSGGSWTQEQFWQTAAFFVPRSGQLDIEVLTPYLSSSFEQQNGKGSIRLPGRDQAVEGRFLDGKLPEWKDDLAPRQVFADWLVARDNRWFARATVNRVWHYLFGTGLVTPVNGFGSNDNPPSHPELLDELARQFIASDFDMKFLLRALVSSRAYQLTSKQGQGTKALPRSFGRAALRGMSPEQLYHSILQATGYLPASGASAERGLYGTSTPLDEFRRKFSDPRDEPAEVQASIQQALFLMNGKFIEQATSPEQSPILKTVIESKAYRTVGRRIEALYLATLSRRPGSGELAELVTYVESAPERGQALRDIFWSLLNSTEFVLVH